MVLGAGTLSHCWKPYIQADLYSSAWVRLGGSMLPADFILLTNSCLSGSKTQLIPLHSET
jgi:hypothetical protein